MTYNHDRAGSVPVVSGGLPALGKTLERAPFWLRGASLKLRRHPEKDWGPSRKDGTRIKCTLHQDEKESGTLLVDADKKNSCQGGWQPQNPPVGRAGAFPLPSETPPPLEAPCTHWRRSWRPSFQMNGLFSRERSSAGPLDTKRGREPHQRVPRLWGPPTQQRPWDQIPPPAPLPGSEVDSGFFSPWFSSVPNFNLWYFDLGVKEENLGKDVGCQP